MREDIQQTNPLGTGKINELMVKFAVPSIIAMMVGAVYNIADQLFIGNAVGTLGNAATNIAFPLSMMCTALGLLFGIGGASGFNLHMGAGDKHKAPYFIGNAVTMLLGTGVILLVITELFLSPMLRGFGSPADVLPLAKQYVGITAIGFPFLIVSTGGGNLMRADGSPRMTMLCNLAGALINIVLDALFVMVFHWGMAGAAVATIIGQIFSGVWAIAYLTHCKTVKVTFEHWKLRGAYIKEICALGMAAFFNQLAMMVVQIAMNNLLKHYGALSHYGESIPIACAGIVMKVNMLYFSIIIGLAQASQPIESFNYGAKQYQRVKQAYGLAMKVGAVVSVIAFILFQTFPRQILSMFGDGSEEYFQFGIKFVHIFLFLTWLNFVQPITSTFFTSIGKAYKGTFLSLTRQFLFFLPFLFIFAHFMGIEGILYAAPVADLLAFVVACVMMVREYKQINQLEKELQNAAVE